MKISSDWVIYHLRSFNYCNEVGNRDIGKAVKEVLEIMGYKPPTAPDRNVVPFRPEPDEPNGMGFAGSGYIYEIDVDRLPEFFKKLSHKLSFPLV